MARGRARGEGAADDADDPGGDGAPPDPDVFRPELAGNLTRIIQGLVVLFVGADLLIIYLWRLRRKLKLGRPKALPQEVPQA